MIQHTLPGCEPIGPPTKRCGVCLQFKPLTEYFADHSRRDGLTRACRSCDAARHRRRWRENAEAMRNRARKRYDANLIANRERAAERRRSERGRELNKLAVARYRARNGEKRSAHEIVSRAIASGTLVRADRCDMAHLGNCSGRIEAHHVDYGRPLAIVWLCVEHHQATHRKPRTLPHAPLLQLLREGEPEGNHGATREQPEVPDVTGFAGHP
jgi:hypothetical protein